MPSAAQGGLSSQYANPQLVQDMRARRAESPPILSTGEEADLYQSPGIRQDMFLPGGMGATTPAALIAEQAYYNYQPSPRTDSYMGVPGAAPPIVGQQAVTDQSIVGSALASFRDGVSELLDAIPLVKLALGGTVTDPRVFSQIAQAERPRMATPISRGAERLGQAGSVVEALGQVVTNPQGQIDLASRSFGGQVGSYLAAPALGAAAWSWWQQRARGSVDGRISSANRSAAGEVPAQRTPVGDSGAAAVCLFAELFNAREPECGHGAFIPFGDGGLAGENSAGWLWPATRSGVRRFWEPCIAPRARARCLCWCGLASLVACATCCIARDFASHTARMLYLARGSVADPASL
jgi:hypothetical protein